MKIVKKFAAYMILAAMSLSVVGCSGGNNDTAISTEQGQVIATVNGENIYQSDFDALYKEYYNYFGANEEAAKYLDEQKELLVEELVNTEVLMQKADELGITCTDEEAQETYNEIKAQYGEELFNQMLAYSNITEEDYLNELKRQIVLMDLQEEMLKDSKPITDEEIKTYYDEHQDEFKVGAGADMKHILVRVTDENDKAEMAEVEAAVKEIQAELAAGKTFEELFEKYSAEDADTDLYIAEDLGFVEYESPYLDPAFLEGAKDLTEGEVSNPVKSSFGYHFIKVDNITEEKVLPLEEVKSTIASKLQEEEDFAIYQKVLNNWVSEAKVKTYEDRITIPEMKEATQANTENTTTQESTQTEDATATGESTQTESTQATGESTQTEDTTNQAQ